MNKVFWVLAVGFFLIGGYTILTVYSKIAGTPKAIVFNCPEHSLEDKCIIQDSFNRFLDRILPDKNVQLIEKFSPTPMTDEDDLSG